MANSANAVLDVKVNGAQAASREMDRFGQSIGRASRAQTQLAGSANKANQSLRLIRGGAGQLGHQIQDIAVQLQGGTSAMIVFGQQGSQIASLMGPKGALIGAVLAVSAAIGTTLLNSFKSTKEMMAELEKSFGDLDQVMSYDAKKSAYELTEEFIRLHKTSKDLAELQLKVKYVQALSAVSTAQDMLGDSTSSLTNTTNRFVNSMNAGVAPTLDGLGRKFGATDEQYRRLVESARAMKDGNEGAAASFIRVANEIAGTSGKLTPAYNELIAPIVDQAMALANAEERAAYLKGALDNLGQAITDSSTDFVDNVSKLEKLIQGYEEQATATLLSARSMALYKAAVLGANQADFERINAAFDLIEKEEARKESVKSATTAYKDQQKEIKASEKVMKGLADGMADAIIKAENMKDAFRSMAQSIVQDLLKIYLQQQITGLIGMFATMPTAMKYNTNLGSQQTKMLMAQDAGMGVTSWDGGGFTGFGARAGGLDGKGGFMAMLHPNETVVDHTKGQGMGDSIVINLNVATGVAQTVRAEMMNLMPAITNATKAAVADARIRGGSFSKQMVGA